jgi:hypothetical protein
MSIQETVLLAMKHGYNNPEPGIIHVESTLLDPLFWQCLGKALGWGEKICPNCGTRYVEGAVICGETQTCFPEKYYLKVGWLYHWHRFIDHLAEGKSVEVFFRDL